MFAIARKFFPRKPPVQHQHFHDTLWGVVYAELMQKGGTFTTVCTDSQIKLAISPGTTDHTWNVYTVHQETTKPVGLQTFSTLNEVVECFMTRLGSLDPRKPI